MGRVPGIKAAQRSMKHKLGWYMAALAAILIAAVCIGLFAFGRLSSPKGEIGRSIQTQLDFFRDDMHALWQNVATSGVHLSEDMTEILEDCLAAGGTDFSALTGDLATLTAIEDAMIDPLCQYLRQTRCSGAFVMLNAAMRADSGPDARSGLCIQKNNAERTGNELLLFRGMSGVGKAHGVMPHRKWQQEFRVDQFPNFAASVGAVGSLWDACRITDLVTLPGTSERAMFLTVPLAGRDGTVYGICGFSVNQTYFGAHFEQPSDLNRLACILTSDTGGALAADAGLITYTRDGSCTLPGGALSAEDMGSGLVRFSGGGYDFVGKMERVTFVSGEDSGHTLAVLIPREDYDRTVLGGLAQTAIFAFLLVFFAAACCTIFARRYLRPVYEDLKRLQALESDRLTFDDFEPLTAAYTAREAEHRDLRSRYEQTQNQLEAARANARELASRRRGELDPADFELFLLEYRKFSDKQKLILDDMVAGLSPQESADRLNYQKSTVYSYRRDIYEKLNITGRDKLQQLRLRIALLRQEEKGCGT